MHGLVSVDMPLATQEPGFGGRGIAPSVLKLRRTKDDAMNDQRFEILEVRIKRRGTVVDGLISLVVREMILKQLYDHYMTII